MSPDYDDSEPADYEAINIEEEVDNDEIDPIEAAFLKGYEEDQEDSFDEEDD